MTTENKSKSNGTIGVSRKDADRPVLVHDNRMIAERASIVHDNRMFAERAFYCLKETL